MLKNIFVIISVGTVIFVIITDYTPQGRVYDCSLAEFHSDYPIEVKDECRRLIKEYNDKENRLHT